MSDHEKNEYCDPSAGDSCRTSGSGCPACGGGKLLLLILGGLAVAYFVASRPASAPAAPSAVPWAKNYDQAVAKAAETNQPLLLAFKATWCGPCRAMDNEVFAKPAAAKALSDWVPVHIDVDENARLATKYGVSGVPTFVALSPGGKEIARAEGAMSLQQFAAFLAQAQSRLPAPTAAKAI